MLRIGRGVGRDAIRRALLRPGGAATVVYDDVLRVRDIREAMAGIRAAVRAGLGVTARSIEMLTPELKVLGEADGLPRLPDVDFHLYLGDHTTSVAARRLFEALAQPRPVI